MTCRPFMCDRSATCNDHDCPGHPKGDAERTTEGLNVIHDLISAVKEGLREYRRLRWRRLRAKQTLLPF
jgi:hypothetical protein